MDLSILIYLVTSPPTPKGLIKSIKTKFSKIIFTSIFWKPLLNYHPFCFCIIFWSWYWVAKLEFPIFQESFKEEAPLFLLVYSDYDQHLKWWLNIPYCLFPPKLKLANTWIPLLVFHPYKHHEYKIYIMKSHNNIIKVYINKLPHQRIVKALVHPSKYIIMWPIHTSIKYYIKFVRIT